MFILIYVVALDGALALKNKLDVRAVLDKNSGFFLARGVDKNIAQRNIRLCAVDHHVFIGACENIVAVLI